MQGDALASGARAASFVTGGKGMSELAWDLRVLPREDFERKYPDKNYDHLIEQINGIKAGSHL